jgi:hypothetical protein
VCRVVDSYDVPVGYAQALDAALAQESQQPGLLAGTWDVRVLLAPSATVQDAGRSVLHSVLKLITDEVFATSLALACCSLVPVRCEAAVRAYEQTGFRWQRLVQDASLGPAWLMLRERLR